jgi:glycosyltransferase involved in cell wall biosynthesis
MTLRFAPSLAAPDHGFFGHLFRLLYAQYLSLRHPRSFFFNTSQLEAMLFRKKQAIMVHDIIPLLVPRNHTRQRWYFTVLLPLALRPAAAVITPSHTVKKLLMETYGLDEAKIDPIHHGAEHALERTAAAAPRRPGYLLFLGRTSSHKNLDGMLRAFDKVTDRLPLDLVVLGVSAEGRAPGAWENRIVYRCYVSSAERYELYRNAEALVFISHHEGFGLPPLEAMLLGCPVVASRTSCIPEICGDAAFYVDPLDADSVAEGIRSVVEDRDLRERLIRKGRKRAQQFTWQRSAERHLLLFDRMLSARDREVEVTIPSPDRA